MTDKKMRIIEIILTVAGLESLFDGANDREPKTEPVSEVKTIGNRIIFQT